MARWKLTLEYHGGGFIGWQKQDGQKSVQQAVEDAVFAYSGERADVVGAGRTDAGVHATAQVAHVDIAKEAEAFSVMQGINFHLFSADAGNRIAVTRAEKMADDFHARFSATRRHYVYRIINRRARLGLEAGRAWHVIEPLDENAMREGAKHLLGHHDFTSFRDSECQAKSPEKTLDRLDVARKGEEIHIVCDARSFLHHQVRIMVGTLAQVGRGKWQPYDVQVALRARDRTRAGPTAPADGLYLVGVDY